MKRNAPFVLPAIVFLGITGLSLALGMINYSWESWRPATCLIKNHCFCEGVRAGIVRQLANTYSNLAFVLVGLWLWGIVRKDEAEASEKSTPPNLMASSKAYSTTYILVAISLGLFSMFFHASLSFVGQWFDIQSMYLIGTFLVIYNLARTYTISPRAFVAIYILSNIVLGVMQAVLPSFRRYVFGSLLIGAAITFAIDRAKRNPKMKSSWFYGSLISLFAAFGIWLLDINKIICDPRSLFQGHAFWHALCAVATGLIFLYYRSEQPTLTQPPNA